MQTHKVHVAIPEESVLEVATAEDVGKHAPTIFAMAAARGSEKHYLYFVFDWDAATNTLWVIHLGEKHSVHTSSSTAHCCITAHETEVRYRQLVEQHGGVPAAGAAAASLLACVVH